LEQSDGTESPLFCQLRRIVARELDIPIGNLDPRKSLRRDYGLDSVAAVNILFEIERVCDVAVDSELIVGVDTLADAYDALLRILS
jgi:acyl carrier protein